MTMRIGILGGGTAGWLAANHLAVELRAEDVEITLIESEEIGVIGVGEGTVPNIRESLQKFGISEAELLATCDCTLKQGIKFEGWMDDRGAASPYYYHPFSSPYPGGYDVTPFYLSNAESMEFGSVTDSVVLMERGKSAKRVSSPEYQGAVEYAYHFDALKFGQLLAKNATERLGVVRRFETVSGAELNASGDIDYLQTVLGERLDYDFYVDCSGFASFLAEQVLKVPFVDKSGQILTDTVLAQQIATKPTDEIASYTLAKAHGAGWLWDIPLVTRRGVGFVYSSKHMSDEEALAGLAAHTGMKAGDLSPRKIPMRIGYRESFWAKNCVSLGLSQGFVEPLEATSIYLTDFSAELFARNFSVDRNGWEAARGHCNRVVSYAWERTIDFVQLHYAISDRRDTEFWRLNTEGVELSDVLQERLDMWRYKHPKKPDFFSRFDLFDVDNYLFVLYGMKFQTQAKLMTEYEREVLSREIVKNQQSSGELACGLMGQREWLRGFTDAFMAARK